MPKEFPLRVSAGDSQAPSHPVFSFQGLRSRTGQLRDASSWAAMAMLGCVMLIAAAPVWAEEAGGEKVSEAQEAEQAWHTVQSKPFRVEVELDGVVESQATWPVRIELEQFSTNTLELVKGVEHGTRVSRGDVLLKFDADPLQRAIADQEANLVVTDATIERLREDLRLSEQQYDLDLASARRNLERTESDYDRWQEIELPLERKTAEVSLSVARQRLDNAREELIQLQRMYRDEELTEESEEIVLRRQEHTVAVREFELERAEHQYERRIGIDLPRREEDMQHRLALTRGSLERTAEVTPRELEQRRRSLEKQLHDRANAARVLERLNEDLERFTVKAPADGVVYYGSVDRGRWSNAETVAQTMRPGGRFQPNTVPLTLVDDRALRVRASVPENLYYRVTPGLSGYVAPRAFPAITPAAGVEELKHVSGSTFDAIVRIDGHAHADRLRPGMNVKVKLIAYEADHAVTVPAEAIRRASDGGAYVKVRTEAQAGKRRPVKVGWVGDDAVEIVEGLEAGERVKLP